MTGLLLRRLSFLGFASLALACIPSLSRACPFCLMQGQTLTTDVSQANLVLVGLFTNAREGEKLGEGTTDLVIEAVVKKHAILADRKVVTLARYVPPVDKKNKYLVLCDVFQGRITPYRGVAVRADCDIAGYLDGALKRKDSKPSERLAYFFKFLDNPEIEISNDAYREFGNAPYQDYRDMAGDLPADRVAAWLRDPQTPSIRIGLYASILGHCGKEEHARLLRSLLEEPSRKVLIGIDGVVAGYTLLRPKEGWDYLRGMLKDSSREFTQRYAAMRAVRFFWDSRPDVIARKDLAEAVAQLLEQSDIADLAIEDLRKWGYWELADRVLALHGRKSHDVPIIKRAILRYALCCKGSDGGPHAPSVAFVNQLRKTDPRSVSDTEELLQLEAKPPLSPSTDTRKPLKN